MPMNANAATSSPRYWSPADSVTVNMLDLQPLAWHPQERLLAVGGADGTVAAFELAR